MKRYFMTALLCIASFYTLYAQYGGINPDDPGDPNPLYKLTVQVTPSGAAYANISTQKYEAGSSVYVYYNSVSSDYTFKGWTVNGEIISESRYFYYTMPSSDITITAQFEYVEPIEQPFNPESPADPQAPDIKAKHLVTIEVSPQTGGYTNYSSFLLEEGSSQTVRVYTYDDYIFIGWMLGGEIISTSTSLYVTMGTEDLAYTAVFEYAPVPFDPESPEDPGANSFDPFTGHLLIDRFVPGKMSTAITKALGSHTQSEVLSVTVLGQMGANDHGFARGMTNCKSIDLSRTTGYKTLPRYEFRSLSALESVLLPAVIDTIDQYAFYYCSALKKLSLPDSIKVLNSYAFYQCQQLDSIVFPNSLTTIANNAFYNCSGLKTIYWNASKISVLPDMSSYVRNLIIGDSIEVIPQEFCSFIYLENIVLGKNVKIIDDYAFYYAGYNSSNLKIHFNDALDSIGNGAFMYTGYSETDTLRLPSNVKYGQYVFAYSKLKNIDINGLEILPQGMFYNCTNMTNITFPSTLKSIGNEAFAYCSKLNDVEFPNSLEQIGSNAFMNCRALKSVVWDASQITENPLRNNYSSSSTYSTVEIITFGNHITSIPEYFCGTKNNSSFRNLYEIIIGKNVTEIGDHAFHSSPVEYIFALPTTPPVPATDLAFSLSSPSYCTVYVPCGTKENYSATWTELTHFVGEVLDNYDVVSEDTNRGTVQITKYADCNDRHVQATATPQEGFKFLYWNEPNDTVKTLNVEITQDTLFTAHFASLYRSVFMNYDSTELLNEEYILGTSIDEVIANYPGEEPKAEGNERYTYLFNSWLHVEDENGNQLFYAVFDTIPNGNSAITTVSYIGDNWNDISASHPFVIEGFYGNEEAIDGIIQYEVENSGKWLNLTDTIAAYESFRKEINIQFDTARHTHVVRFRSVDKQENVVYFDTIQYIDIREFAVLGVQNKVYNGSAQYQTSITVKLDSTYYSIGNYKNNINAGKASFEYAGVYPYSIGSQTYSFTISPATLLGEIKLAKDSVVYSGYSQTVSWSFTNEAYANLVSYTDYYSEWSNNRYPGVATLNVYGRGNYTGTLSANLTILKAPLPLDMFSITLPDDTIMFDGIPHGASVTTSVGVGSPTITYRDVTADTLSIWKPKYRGTYEIYLSIAEGDYYQGLENQKIGQFTVVSFDDEEWEAIQAIYAYLIEHNWKKQWDISAGMECVPYLQGLTLTNAHITGLDLSNDSISGDFPIVVLKLPYLNNLNLSQNQLSGNIEKSLKDSTHMSLMNVNLSNNNLSGNVGKFALAFPNMSSLNVAHNNISQLTPVLSSKITNLDISYQQIDTVTVLDFTKTIDDETYLSSIPTIILYWNESHDYESCQIILSNEAQTWKADFGVYESEIYWNNSSYSGQNVYKGASGDTLNVTDFDYNSTYKTKIMFSQGDADFSTTVDVVDLQAVLNYIFGQWSNSKPFNFTAANLYVDERITIQDIILMVDLLLNQETQTSPQAMPRQNGEETAAEEAKAVLYWKNGELHLYSVQSVAAIDVTVESSEPIEWVINSHTVKSRDIDNGQKAVIYSLGGSTFAAGRDIVLAHTSDMFASVKFAMLVDSCAMPIITSLNTEHSDVITDVIDVNRYDIRISLLDRILYILSEISDLRWCLYDVSGKLCANNKFSGECKYDMTNMSDGVYLIVLTDDRGEIVLTEKIIK